MKTFLVIIVLYLLCGYKVLDGIAENKIYNIGVIIDLSGPSVAVGDQCQQGLNTALDLYSSLLKQKGYDLQLHYGDSANLPSKAVSEFNRLVDIEKVQSLIITRSMAAMPINPISRAKQIVYTTTAAHPNLVKDNPYVFRFWPNTKIEGKKIAEFLIEKNIKTIASVTCEDEWALSLLEEFKVNYLKHGGEIRLEESVAPTDQDFNTIIAKIRATKADAVFGNLCPYQEGVFFKKLNESKIAALKVANVWLNTTGSIEAAGKEALEGTIYFEANTTKPLFLSAFHKRYGTKSRPSGVTYSCYLCLGATLIGASNLANPMDQQELYSWLSTVKQLPYADGEILMEDRQGVLELNPQIFKDGKVESLPDSFSGLQK